jgi:nucleoside-diphosphate-sugar epimerase
LVHANLQLGTELLEFAVTCGVKWFLNTGTFWQHFQDHDYSPVNLYAATKESFETLARYYLETSLLNYATLELSDTYGPDDTRGKIIYLLLEHAGKQTSIDLSAGEQLLDLCFIDDVVNCYELLIRHLELSSPGSVRGSRYGTSASTRISLKGLVGAIEQVTGLSIHANWGALPYREREVMIPWTRSVRVNGWSPDVNLEDGIRRIWRKLKDEQ